jgi:hypothetical protein
VSDVSPITSGTTGELLVSISQSELRGCELRGQQEVAKKRTLANDKTDNNEREWEKWPAQRWYINRLSCD